MSVLYNHEHRFGPYAEAILAKFDADERASRDGKLRNAEHVQCVCGFSRKRRDQMVKHLNGNKGCYYERIQRYWKANGFATVSNTTRFVAICQDLDLEVYQDKRPYSKGASSWETWAPKWAVDFFHAYLASSSTRHGHHHGLSRKDVCARGLDNMKDWMLRTMLTEARDDEEFRNAVRGAQRLKTLPEDQCVLFKTWLEARGIAIPANIRVKAAK